MCAINYYLQFSFFDCFLFLFRKDSGNKKTKAQKKKEKKRTNIHRKNQIFTCVIWSFIPHVIFSGFSCFSCGLIRPPFFSRHTSHTSGEIFVVERETFSPESLELVGDISRLVLALVASPLPTLSPHNRKCSPEWAESHLLPPLLFYDSLALSRTYRLLISDSKTVQSIYFLYAVCK